MSFSSGTYSLPGPALNTGDTVSATENNTFRNDVATAFNLTWLRNGTAAATADIPMGGFSFTNCAAVGSAGSLLLKTNGGTTAVTFDTAQNMGLGVTPSAWYGTNYKAFQIGVSGLLASTTNGNIRLMSNAYLNGSASNIYQTTGNGAGQYEQAGGEHRFYNAPSGTAGGTITFTQAMTLDASGNLGVGSTAPSTDGVSGYRNLVIGTSSASAAGITMLTNNTGSTTQGVVWSRSAGTANGFVKYDHYYDALTFGTATAERARIDTSGNFFVGYSSYPSVTLYVGTATNGATAQGGISANGGSGALIDVGHASGTASGSYYHRSIYNGSVIGSITQNGTTGVLYNLTSDYRLKNNPTPVTGAKEFVMALQPKTWDWWDGSGKGVGFIAHEFMEVAKYSGHGEKDAVETVEIKDEEGNVTGTEERPVYQSIQPSSSEVMANLVALLQEQQAIIDAQQTVLTTLTQRIKALEGAKA